MISDYYQYDNDTSHCRLIVQIFCHRLVLVNRDCNSLQVAYFLLAIFHTDRSILFSKHDVWIKCKGFFIVLSLNFWIRMLILSQPWAFPRSYFLLTYNMSSPENLTPFNVFPVACKNSYGIRLLFVIGKSELKISLFRWKSVTKLFLCKGVLW